MITWARSSEELAPAGFDWISCLRAPQIAALTADTGPLQLTLVVRHIDADEKTAGSIVIPDTAKEKPEEGEVVAAGRGARNEKANSSHWS